VCLIAALWWPAALWLLLVLPLFILGCWDLLQQRHTLMRNYPVTAHFRWLFESLRPYLHSYIVEDDLGGGRSATTPALWYTHVPKVRPMRIRSALNWMSIPTSMNGCRNRWHRNRRRRKIFASASADRSARGRIQRRF
jgi:hypothetical protein